MGVNKRYVPPDWNQYICREHINKFKAHNHDEWLKFKKTWAHETLDTLLGYVVQTDLCVPWQYTDVYQGAHIINY